LETVSKKKTSFLKRGILLGAAALLLFIILVLFTYPYERTVERALSRVNRESAVSVYSAQTDFFFPNSITFRDLKLVPKEKPYHLLETRFTKLSAQVALGPLLTKTLRVRLTGDLDSGDPSEGQYQVSGTVSLRRGEKQGPDGLGDSRVVELENVRLNGSYVNLTVDGNVTFGGDILDPDVELKFAVEKLERTDSANYAIENLLRFVEGAVPSESRPPLAFAVSGPFSQLTVRQEQGESGTEG
jgi:hypothetical protein